MRARFIYEKFTEESDPIQDMGIGMQKIWAEQSEEIGTKSADEVRKKYFKKIILSRIYNHRLGYGLYIALKRLGEGYTLDKALKNLWKGFGTPHLNSKTELKIKNAIRNVIENNIIK